MGVESSPDAEATSGDGPERGKKRLSPVINDYLLFSGGTPETAVPQSLQYADPFRVVISQFLDRFNFDLGTVKRSCVHFVQPDGQIIPFDTYNTFYRPGAAGNAALAKARS